MRARGNCDGLALGQPLGGLPGKDQNDLDHLSQAGKFRNFQIPSQIFKFPGPWDPGAHVLTWGAWGSRGVLEIQGAFREHRLCMAQRETHEHEQIHST